MADGLMSRGGRVLGGPDTLRDMFYCRKNNPIFSTYVISLSLQKGIRPARTEQFLVLFLKL